MPKNSKPLLLTFFFIMTLFGISAFKPEALASEGITVYYSRYDIKSSNNKITGENLLMVPAKNEFRAENFSGFSSTGVISSSQGESRASVEQRIKEDSIKTILLKHGLKSVKSKDYETVISYEGVVITPVDIVKNSYHEEDSSYFYEVRVEFAPIAFPDRWETMGIKNRVKQIVSNFFNLFM